MSQMNSYCERHYSCAIATGDFREGDQISYEIDVYDKRWENKHTERRVGTIVELWLENHPNVGRPILYAETTNTRGEAHRVWFHRDNVKHAADVEVELGAQPEGAMF